MNWGGTSSRVSGKFIGVFRVFTHEGKRFIADFPYFDFFEDGFPSDHIDGEGLSGEFYNGDFIKYFLDFPEVIKIEKEEFFCEVYGNIQFIYSRDYWGECDVDMEIDNFHLRLLDEEKASFFLDI